MGGERGECGRGESGKGGVREVRDRGERIICWDTKRKIMQRVEWVVQIARELVLCACGAAVRAWRAYCACVARVLCVWVCCEVKVC